MDGRNAAALLVVDDELSITEALSELLAWEGYSVSVAPNGRRALDILAREHVDLVLLDVMMPVMSGVDTLAAMREDDRLRSIPVILMTAGPIPDAARDAAAVLRKPFEVGALLAAIDRALERS